MIVTISFHFQSRALRSIVTHACRHQPQNSIDSAGIEAWNDKFGASEIKRRGPLVRESYRVHARGAARGKAGRSILDHNAVRGPHVEQFCCPEVNIGGRLGPGNGVRTDDDVEPGGEPDPIEDMPDVALRGSRGDAAAKT